MLLVPLALLLPGEPSETAEEVVLAAGGPEGEGAVEEPDEVALAEFDDELGDEVPAPAPVEAQAVARPGTKRVADRPAPASTRSAGARTSTTRRRSLTSTLLRRKPSTTTTTAARPATTVRAAVPLAVTTTRPPPPPPPPPVPNTTSNSDWDRLAQCESGNTNDPDAPYYGYWQFSAETWHSMGQTGLPDQYSREHQLAVAKRLHAARGWAPWPACSRQLGLT